MSNQNGTVSKPRARGNDNNNTSNEHSSRISSIISEFGGGGCFTDKLVRLYKYRANKMTEMTLLDEAIRVVEGQVDAESSSVGDTSSVTCAKVIASAETDRDGVLMPEGACKPEQLTSITLSSAISLTLSTNCVISALYETNLNMIFPIVEKCHETVPIASATASTTLASLLDALHNGIKDIVGQITPITTSEVTDSDFISEDADLPTSTIPIEALAKLVVTGEELCASDQDILKEFPTIESIESVRFHLYNYLISLIALAVCPDTWGLKESQKSLKVAVIGTKKEKSIPSDVRVLVRAVVLLGLISKPKFLQKVTITDINKNTKVEKKCNEDNITALYKLPFLAPVMSDTIGAPFAVRVIGYLGQCHFGGVNTEVHTLLRNLGAEKFNGNVLRNNLINSTKCISSKNGKQVSGTSTLLLLPLNFFLELSSHTTGVKIISKICEILGTAEEFHMFVRLMLGLTALPTENETEDEYTSANNAIIHLIRDLNGNTILTKLMGCNTFLQSYTPCDKLLPCRSEENDDIPPIINMTPEQIVTENHIKRAHQLLFCTIIHNSIAISCTRQGCCFIQRCLQCFNDDVLLPQHHTKDAPGKSSEENDTIAQQGISYRQRLVNTVLSDTITLSQDSFGNYVVQFLLDQECPLTAEEKKDWEGKESVQWPSSQQVPGSSKKVISDQASRRRVNKEIAASFHPYTTRIVRQLLHNIAALSQNKFSSNVIEKCLKTTTTDVKQLLIDEITDPVTLPKLLTDRFGNYVVQSAITSSSSGKQFNQVREAILPLSQLLKNSPYGLKIEAKLDRRLQEERTSNRPQKQHNLNANEDLRGRCAGRGRNEQLSFNNSNNMRHAVDRENQPHRGMGSWPQQGCTVMNSLSSIHDHRQQMHIMPNTVQQCGIGEYSMDYGGLSQQNIPHDGTGGFGFMQSTAGLSDHPGHLPQGLGFPLSSLPSNLGNNAHVLLQHQQLLPPQQYYMLQYIQPPNHCVI